MRICRRSATRTTGSILDERSLVRVHRLGVSSFARRRKVTNISCATSFGISLFTAAATATSTTLFGKEKIHQRGAHNGHGSADDELGLLLLGRHGMLLLLLLLLLLFCWVTSEVLYVLE